MSGVPNGRWVAFGSAGAAPCPGACPGGRCADVLGDAESQGAQLVAFGIVGASETPEDGLRETDAVYPAKTRHVLHHDELGLQLFGEARDLLEEAVLAVVGTTLPRPRITLARRAG